MSDELDYPPTQEATKTVESPSVAPATPRAVQEPSARISHTEHAFKKSVVREYFESAVVTLVMALFGMTFIVQAVKVPTGSMKNTIWIQDHLLVNKFIFGPHNRLKVPILPERDIRRGDVVVF